jgi:hypothetical protein
MQQIRKDTPDPSNVKSSESNISIHLNDFESQGYIEYSCNK